MPIKKLLFIAACGLMIGGLSVRFYQNLPSRNPASQLPPPKLHLKPWADSLYGKMHQAMDVKISAVGGVPDHDDQEIRLKGEVTLNRPMDQEVKFMWVLPPDATVVSGELEDSFPNLKAGQTATTEIVIQGVSKESFVKTVTLHVSGSAGGVQYASAGGFATNSREQMTAASDSGGGVSKLQNEELALKKSDSAAKMEKVHQ